MAKLGNPVLNRVKATLIYTGGHKQDSEAQRERERERESER